MLGSGSDVILGRAVDYFFHQLSDSCNKFLSKSLEHEFYISDDALDATFVPDVEILVGRQVESGSQCVRDQSYLFFREALQSWLYAVSSGT
jgi:hypothetical protein